MKNYFGIYLLEKLNYSGVFNRVTANDGVLLMLGIF